LYFYRGVGSILGYAPDLYTYDTPQFPYSTVMDITDQESERHQRAFALNDQAIILSRIEKVLL